MKLAHCITALVLAAANGPAFAQGWTPTRNVEIVAGSAPGGSNDRTARLLEKVLSQYKLTPTTITVVNKAGGGGSIAYTYAAQKNADPHVLVVTSGNILSNRILGTSPLTLDDLTPIASMTQDYAVFAVNSASSIKTGKELVAQLKKDPRSLNVGFANAFGSSRHMALGLLIKAIGANPKEVKPVVFKGSAEAITALLGQHLEYVVIGAVNSLSHVASGRMRVLAVASPQRLSGPLSNVPTWREQGVDLVHGSWRGFFGAKGISPAQVAYWEATLKKVSETPEWKSDSEKNYWTDEFVTGAGLKKLLEQDYAESRAVLTELGLAK